MKTPISTNNDQVADPTMVTEKKTRFTENKTLTLEERKAHEEFFQLMRGSSEHSGKDDGRFYRHAKQSAREEMLNMQEEAQSLQYPPHVMTTMASHRQIVPSGSQGGDGKTQPDGRSYFKGDRFPGDLSSGDLFSGDKFSGDKFSGVNGPVDTSMPMPGFSNAVSPSYSVMPTNPAFAVHGPTSLAGKIAAEIAAKIPTNGQNGELVINLKSQMLPETELVVKRYYGELSVTLTSGNPTSVQWLQGQQGDLLSRLQQRFSHDTVKLKIDVRGGKNIDDDEQPEGSTELLGKIFRPGR